MSFWQKIFGPSPTSIRPNILSLLNLQEEDEQKIRKLDPRLVVGKVLEVASHPDPEITKVKVTKTKIAPDKSVQILCGGTNVQEGIIVAVATEGTILPGNFEIGVRAIRGVESHGMICARSELEISPSEEEKGEIWILPSALEEKIGTPLRNL